MNETNRIEYKLEYNSGIDVEQRALPGIRHKRRTEIPDGEIQHDDFYHRHGYPQ